MPSRSVSAVAVPTCSRVTRTSANARATDRSRESSVTMRSTASVAYTWSERPSRRSTRPERVIQFRIGEHDPLDGHVAIACRRVAVELLHLVPDIGRRVEEEPVRAVGADGGRRLGSREGPSEDRGARHDKWDTSNSTAGIRHLQPFPAV